MHFSFPLPNSLILLLFASLQHLSFAAPAPEANYDSTPTPIPVLEGVGGGNGSSLINLADFSGGAALQISTGETRVYYQSEDGALHELSGFDSPGSGNVYTDSTILSPGEARKGTPLAATDLTLSFVVVSLFPL